MDLSKSHKVVHFTFSVDYEKLTYRKRTPKHDVRIPADRQQPHNLSCASVEILFNRPYATHYWQSAHTFGYSILFLKVNFVHSKRNLQRITEITKWIHHPCLIAEHHPRFSRDSSTTTRNTQTAPFSLKHNTSAFLVPFQHALFYLLEINNILLYLIPVIHQPHTDYIWSNRPLPFYHMRKFCLRQNCLWNCTCPSEWVATDYFYWGPTQARPLRIHYANNLVFLRESSLHALLFFEPLINGGVRLSQRLPIGSLVFAIPPKSYPSQMDTSVCSYWSP